MNSTVVLAIGGNAIVREQQKGYLHEQMENIDRAMEQAAGLIERGYRVIVTHGNGPQVGNILIQNESARALVPGQPLDICVAQTQGQIGDMIVRSLHKILLRRGTPRTVAAVVTHVEVDPDDPAFLSPSKPVGPFYSREEAFVLQEEKRQTFREDSGRGYRRVVPSPMPRNILEGAVIRILSEQAVVVAVGGGGVPVCLQNGEMQGLEAVIDKDHASALLAAQIGAELLITLTAVPQVALDFGKPTQRFLSHLNVEQAKAYLEEGQFPMGSMGPKIQAAINYLKSGGGQVLITSIEALPKAIAGEAGTRITLAQD